MRHMTSRLVSFTLLSLLLCPSVFAQDALQLFHKMQEALGGAENIAAVRDFEQRLQTRARCGLIAMPRAGYCQSGPDRGISRK